MAQVRDHGEIDRTAVCAGRGGGPAGLAGIAGRGDRRRPGCVRPLGGGPGRVQGVGRAGLPGRDRGDLRVGGLAAGPVVGGPVPAAGVRPADRHPGHRLRRDLRPGRVQRPVAAGPEGDDERGRVASAGRPVAGRQTGRGRTRRAAHPAADRLRLRRPGAGDQGPGRGGGHRDRGPVHGVHRDRLGLPGGRLPSASGGSRGVPTAGRGPGSCSSAGSPTPGCWASWPTRSMPAPTSTAGSAPGAPSARTARCAR